ncbi:hypothetical protein [Algoriphagus zhangzhouensis]|uniref:VLRF1 domain-containing protein n=1 Tax=Algoriphagus zhangzhouensis TaxID=1073327 RepID=A0A1M7Z568_9BACT|nr:hypothetical protein [Algoriphagus zhangzhouensis]TDY48875.1 hypothetical protein A8938_0564 [Algoriphagus zhangzhouensis]SHO60088.1 hypothetical protein SAMN04488108_0564 [Algoriphagus zhangzhouensis]
MKIPNSKIILPEQFDQVLEHANSNAWELSYSSEKHQLVISNEEEWIARIFLPWNMNWENEKLIPVDNFHCVLVAIKAGQAAVGYFHEKELLDHKVFRAYMVRQKQGKSQIKHLKTKGKSRAGSRIRLEETERFFEDISERLNRYENDFPISVWGISCAKTLWPYFFGSETTPPFESGSELLRSLPFHFHQGSYEELEMAGKLINQFHWLPNSDKNIEIVLSGSKESEPDEDDW